MFEVGAQLGFNYNATNLVELVENVTGVYVAKPAVPKVCLYWLVIILLFSILWLVKLNAFLLFNSIFLSQEEAVNFIEP